MIPTWLKFRKSTYILVGLISGCVVVIVVAVLVCKGATPFDFDQYYADIHNSPAEDVNSLPPPSNFPMGVFKHGAVVSNGVPCAAIGRKILEKYKNAVDAAIATQICESAVVMQSMGLGGGFLATVYSKGEVMALNARESAPKGSTVDMFHGNPNSSTVGGLSIAVPGELRGIQAMYTRYGGKAPWNELFTDTIDLCENGFKAVPALAAAILNDKELILQSPTFMEMIKDVDGKLPSYGSTIKLPKLAETLRVIAKEGADALYNGSLAARLVEDIKNEGGIITLEDLAEYQALWTDPIKGPLSNNMTLYTVPAPGSGPVLSFILRVLDTHLPSKDTLTDTQRITEAFKHAYGLRTHLADPNFTDITEVMNLLTSEDNIKATWDKIRDNSTSQNFTDYGGIYQTVTDKGTANIVVIGPDGDAVVLTSTVNTLFGSKVVSRSTGIILNNEMDDFSAPDITNYFGLPPSQANFISPGKRPLSSMCPALVIYNNGTVRLAVGAAGGTKITTATALVIIRNIWFNMNIKEAVDMPRFHHQLSPMVWQYEYGNLKSLVTEMKATGHKVQKISRVWTNSATGIARTFDGNLTTLVDFRRPGMISGY